MITYQNLGKNGRFANQLWQIASTIGIAIAHGYEYAFPEWMNHDHKDRYGSQEDIDVQTWFKNPLPVLPAGIEFRTEKIPWGYHKVSLPNENISLDGYLQCEKYFKHCEETIRHFFRIDPDMLPDHIGNFVPTDFIFGSENESLHETCAIHVRLTDYTLPEKKNYHTNLAREYYRAAADLFGADIQMIVFSDDPKGAQQLLGDVGSNAIFVAGNHYMTDFALMTLCENFIISNSSYSWWAAWLSENEQKKIIAPKNWFGPDAAAEGLTSKDLYPDGWVLI